MGKSLASPFLRTAVLAAALSLPMAVLPAPAPAADPPGRASAPADNAAWDLDRVVRTALERHPQAGQADAETRAASARKGQAQSAWFPTIGLSAGYSRSRDVSDSPDESRTSDIGFLRGSLSQVLTDFGRTGASVDRADALLASAKETGRSVREDIAFNAKVAYYNVLRAKRLLSVNRETAGQRESLLRQARAFYDAGIRARIDVARAEANLFQARAQLTAAENDLRVARITLLNRMGVDGPREFELLDTLAGESVPGTLEDWIAQAEAGRPDLRALRERERAADMAVRAARAGHYPVLTGNGEYGYAGDETPFQRGYSVSVLLEVPVFSGFLTRRQVEEAEANLDSARLAVTDFRRQVRLQIEQAALSVRAASEQAEARRKEKEASEENLRLATARYEVGAGDIIEMIDAQVQATASNTNLINALYDTSVSVATLLRAIGR
jgi:TolC family type I secretion outer membrane protein